MSRESLKPLAVGNAYLARNGEIIIIEGRSRGTMFDVSYPWFGCAWDGNKYYIDVTLQSRPNDVLQMRLEMFYTDEGKCVAVHNKYLPEEQWDLVDNALTYDRAIKALEDVK